MLHHLKPYVQFDTVKEMDKHVRRHIQTHTLTKAQLAILYCIAHHALATPGVAHLKAETIAKKCVISTKTVYRTMKLFEQLGILKRIASTKLNGIKAANIYAICPHVPSEMSERPPSKERCQDSADVAKYERESISFESKKSSTNNILRTAWHEKLEQHFQFFPVPTNLQAPLMKAITQLELTSHEQFERAKHVVTQSIYLIATKEVTLYATFEQFIIGAFKKWQIIQQKPAEKTYVSTRPVPFYNWLDERAGN